MPTAAEPLPLLYRDDHLVAIHKPAGWLVHRSGLDAGETRFVVQTLRDQIGQRVHPVHRLDKGTCGVLVLALHPQAARALGEAFAAQQVHKRYLALVRGWPPAALQVDHALRAEDAPADAAAQPAQTRLQCVARIDWPQPADPRFSSTRLALVEAQPLTGRRHQIRRHLKHVAHPILGDATHGKGPLNRWWAQQTGITRLWLHAAAIELPHPASGAPLRLHSGLHWGVPGAPAGLRADAPCADALADWLRLAGTLAPWCTSGGNAE